MCFQKYYIHNSFPTCYYTSDYEQKLTIFRLPDDGKIHWRSPHALCVRAKHRGQELFIVINFLSAILTWNFLRAFLHVLVCCCFSHLNRCHQRHLFSKTIYNTVSWQALGNSLPLMLLSIFQKTFIFSVLLSEDFIWMKKVFGK